MRARDCCDNIARESARKDGAKCADCCDAEKSLHSWPQLHGSAEWLAQEQSAVRLAKRLSARWPFREESALSELERARSYLLRTRQRIASRFVPGRQREKEGLIEHTFDVGASETVGVLLLRDDELRESVPAVAESTVARGAVSLSRR